MQCLVLSEPEILSLLSGFHQRHVLAVSVSYSDLSVSLFPLSHQIKLNQTVFMTFYNFCAELQYKVLYNAMTIPHTKSIHKEMIILEKRDIVG